MMLPTKYQALGLVVSYKKIFFTFFLSEGKNAYFMRGEATNKIYFFLPSQDEINGIFMTKI